MLLDRNHVNLAEIDQVADYQMSVALSELTDDRAGQVQASGFDVQPALATGEVSRRAASDS
jgi:hypothetical protein